MTYKVSTPSGAVLDDSQKSGARPAWDGEDAATAVMTVIVGIALPWRHHSDHSTSLAIPRRPGIFASSGMGGVEKG